MAIVISPDVEKVLGAWKQALNNARSRGDIPEGDFWTVGEADAEGGTWKVLEVQHVLQDFMFGVWHRQSASVKQEVIEYLLASSDSSDIRLLFVLHLHSHLVATLMPETMKRVLECIAGYTMGNWWEV